LIQIDVAFVQLLAPKDQVGARTATALAAKRPVLGHKTVLATVHKLPAGLKRVCLKGGLEIGTAFRSCLVTWKSSMQTYKKSYHFAKKLQLYTTRAHICTL
jgi:hypothetical protein